VISGFDQNIDIFIDHMMINIYLDYFSRIKKWPEQGSGRVGGIELVSSFELWALGCEFVFWLSVLS